jgi:hypothetical protein
MSTEAVPAEAVDPETIALSRVIGALTAIDEDSRRRVLRYAAERFGLSLGDTHGKANRGSSSTTTVQGGEVGSAEYKDIGDLMEHAQPSNGVSRALVVGYWFQVHEKQENFSGRQVNDSLKALGNASANIATVMTQLIERKPSAFIQQVGKSGKAQQARKSYRLTKAGINHVVKMLNGTATSDEE